MESKLVITKSPSYVMSALFEDGKLCELNFDSDTENSILGNIYTGRVKNIVKNINAAFVEIGEGILCYYSLNENKNHIFLTPKKTDKLVAGDEILVQISRENIKTKAPTATAQLTINGKYLILTAGKNRLGVSNKITDVKKREALKEAVRPYLKDDLGFIIRTNCQYAKIGEIEQEALTLSSQYRELIETAKYRQSHTLLYRAPSGYLSQIKDLNAVSLQKIVTDSREIYETTAEYLKKYQPEDVDKLSFYEDPLISMCALYHLKKSVEDAFHERVWLKSGGYLVIQPTEAMTVIDVNTGKALNKKKMEEHFLSINLEASKEIAHQIRLRNLSGIILVDFIDMEKEENREYLKRELTLLLEKDRIQTTLVDITRLNLVEITRKKTKKPIYEQLSTVCPCCHGSGFILSDLWQTKETGKG